MARKSDYRSSQADLMREKRESARIVVVPKLPAENRERRQLLESDDEEWLRFYFPELFWYPWTIQQREMIAAISKAIDTGDDQAIAASRGEGKTKIAERLLLKYTLQGRIKLSVLFAKSGEHAENSLEAIKGEVEESDLLVADYPEVCVPVRALEYTPNRAHYQKVNGFRFDNGEPFEAAPSRFSWCGREIIFPNIPGSPSAGAIIATRGLDASVRGLNKRNRRVDVAVIDDPDTDESSRSEEQAAKLEQRIDRAIGGLGGQKRGCGRVVITTISSRISVSYKLTDPEQKPSMRGRRFKFLLRQPERADLWEEFTALQKQDWRNELDGNKTAAAHEMYVANREAMDDGAEVANHNRYYQGQLSALQFYYTEAARKGIDYCLTELDNDPPEEDGPIESGISATKIQGRLSGYAARVVPLDCVKLTRGVDIRKAGAHFVVKAWRPDATFYVVHYGFVDSHGTEAGTDEAIELAIKRLVLQLDQDTKDEPYRRADGSAVPLDLTLVDSGWQAPAIYQACSEIGIGIYPAKGHGKSHGCASPNFHDIWTRTRDRKPGDGWFMSRLSGNRWLVHCDTDRWKSFEHARWMTPEGKPGAGYLFGEISEEERRYIDKRMPRDAKEHHAFARHLTAEIEVEETVRGALKRFWKVKAGRVQNHYLDASYLADVAASIVGVRLMGEPKNGRVPSSERPTVKDLMAKARSG